MIDINHNYDVAQKLVEDILSIQLKNISDSLSSLFAEPIHSIVCSRMVNAINIEKSIFAVLIKQELDKRI